MASQHPAQRRYPDELKQRAVGLVLEIREKDPADRNAISRVARQLRVGVESLRVWVKQAGDDDGGVRGAQGFAPGGVRPAPGQRDPESGVGFLRVYVTIHPSGCR